LKNFDLPKDVLIQSIEHSNLAHTISRVDGDMELIYVNKAFLDATGYSRDEVLGRNCRFLQGAGTDREVVKKIKAAVTAFESIDVELLNYRKDGSPFSNHLRMSPVLDGSKRPVAYLGIQSDVTQMRQQLQAEHERQKMEALGRMTGNISHEIKNTLQPVKLMAEMLKDWNSLDKQQIDRCVQILHENVGLADHVIQDVLRFSRKSEKRPEKLRICDLKPEVLSFIRTLLHSRIEFSVVENVSVSDGHVEINLNGLFQVLMNLVNNALHAMNDKGAITLHWLTKEIDAAAAHELGLKRGRYLCIGIEDSGCGMDAKTLRSALEPFFSTKPPGEGTGLGLSISSQIVGEWNGALVCKSILGIGSTFSIYLPLS
jgi:PAS domain S-box-containing protein